MNIRVALIAAILTISGCANNGSISKDVADVTSKESGYIIGTIGARVFLHRRESLTDFYFRIRNKLTGVEHTVGGPSRTAGGRPKGPILEEHYMAAPFVLPVEPGSYEIFATGSSRVTSRQVRVPFKLQKSDFLISFEVKRGHGTYIGQWLFHQREPTLSDGTDTGAGYWSICSDAKKDMPFINEHFAADAELSNANDIKGYHTLELGEPLPNVFTGEKACEHRDLSFMDWTKKYGRM